MTEIRGAVNDSIRIDKHHVLDILRAEIRRLVLRHYGSGDPYLGKFVVSGYDLPIRSIQIVEGKIVFYAEFGPGKSAELEGPMTIFGEDNKGILQSYTPMPRTKVTAIDSVGLTYKCQVLFVGPPTIRVPSQSPQL